MFDFNSFWHAHTPILSILIPAFTSFLLVLLGNPGSGSLKQDWRQPWRRGISLGSALLGLITAISYLMIANTGQITVYQLGEWSAPFGIVLVLDRLSAFMLVLTYALAVPVIWYASDNWDTRGRYFHTMFHFLLMGLTGAFLTGDLFNLFVFFEILLMASYVLLLHGQGRPRFQLGVHYVTINLVASALFLIGLGMIYGSVGSLNMTDVAAIFTIMTKMGIYAILRVNGTVFDDALAQSIFKNTLLIIGLITSFYGVIGAIAAERLRRFVGFMVLSSIGTLLIAIAMFNTQAWSAALYYLVHSTLVAAAFYLFCGWMTSQRGSFKDHLKVAPKIKQEKAAAFTYFTIALMMAGLPPFSGFLGKVFILQATAETPYQGWIIGVILVVSLLSIIALTRVGFILFWRASPPEANPKEAAYAAYQALPAVAPNRNDKAIYMLLAGLIAYVVFAAPIQTYTVLTAQQIQNHVLYQQSILKHDMQGRAISVQPFDAGYLPETKYGGEVEDHNALLIPDVISKPTLQGEHISEYKQRQIAEQTLASPTIPNATQLKPMEEH